MIRSSSSNDICYTLAYAVHDRLFLKDQQKLYMYLWLKKNSVVSFSVGWCYCFVHAPNQTAVVRKQCHVARKCSDS